MGACFSWAHEERVMDTDGPVHLVRKARRVRRAAVRHQLLGETRTLGQWQALVDSKTFEGLAKDLELKIDRRLCKEAPAPRLAGNAPPVPALGGAHLLSGAYWKDTIALRQKYGPVTLIQVANLHICFVSDPDVIEDILNVKPTVAPHRTGLNLAMQFTSDGTDLAFCDMGHAWQRRRKATHFAFVKQISQITKRAVMEAQRMVKRVMDTAAKPGEEGAVSIIKEFRTTLISNLGAALYGVEFTPEEIQALSEGLTESFDISIQTDPYDIFESTERLPPHTTYKARMQRAVDKMMDVHKVHVARVKADFNRGQKPSNVLEEYLALQHDGDHSNTLSDFEVLMMMFDIAGAAVDSTSVAGPWVFAWLLNHPESLRRACEEVRAATGDNTRWLRREDVQNLPYLSACFKEAVRLRPPFPIVFRQGGAEPFDLGKFTVPPFTQLVLGMHCVNTTEGVAFDDAGAWRPERWLEEGAKLYPRKLRAFGGGPRICVGSQMAFENVLILSGTIFQSFDIEPWNGQPPNLEMSGKALSVGPMEFKVRAKLVSGSLIEQSRRAIVQRQESYEVQRKASAEEVKRLNSNLTRAPAPVASPSPASVMNIFFCSTQGNTEQMAMSLKSAAAAKGFSVTASDLGDGEPWMSAATSGGTSVFLCSTYYDGEAPDTGKAFGQWLVKQPNGGLGPAFRFAVFASGNSQYQKFNAFGKEVDDQLARLGGTRLCEVGLGDASEDAEHTFEVWQMNLWEALGASQRGVGGEEEAHPACEWHVEWTDEMTSAHRRQSFQGRSCRGSKISLLRKEELACVFEGRRELRQDTSEGSCFEVSFRIKADAEYQAAQNLLLFPRNPSESVQAVARALGHVDDIDRPFSLAWVGKEAEATEPPFPCPTTLRKVLTEECDLMSNPKRALLRELAGWSEDAFERETLRVLLSPGGKEWFDLKASKGFTLVRFLQEFRSVKIPLEHLLALVPRFRMQPRFYTIASSPLADWRLLKLTVTVHEKILVDGLVMSGLCTKWLRGLEHGTPVRAVIQDSGFHFPADPSAPMIMVGAGSGIAPTIAFIEQRQALLKQGLQIGRLAVFFGCRHPEKDFIHQDFLAAMTESGVVSDLHVAFSKPTAPGEKRKYVQDLIMECGAELASLLSQGGRMFVCGGTAMGNAVKTALVQGGALTSQQEMQQLEREGRYVSELWS